MTQKPSQPLPVLAIPKLSEGQLEPLFRRLNLAHTRRIYQEVADRAEKENWTYRDFLALLLAEEVAHRKQTRLQRCTRQAHFPFFKTIDEFDFTLQSTLRQSLLGSYLGPDFVTEGRSLILYGKTGRGKTHLAVAIGYRAIQNGFDTLCTTAAELIEDLSNASAKGLLHQSLSAYTRPHVLVIDEIGYLSYGPDAANVLFHVVNDRHLRKRPMIFTTNKPLSEWGKVLHDEDLAAAILDRVLERGRFVPLDGPSGRTRHLNLEEASSAKAERLRISGINGSEFPEPTLALGEYFDLAQAYLDQANAYLSLGETQSAIQSLQKALGRERQFPNLRTQAWSRFARLVATERLKQLYDDALKVLEEHKPDATSFPVDGFLWNAANALIADGQGQRTIAQEYSTKALHFTELTHSGFRYHPDVGLVGTQQEKLKATLRHIAS